MDKIIQIKKFDKADINLLASLFGGHPWHKPAETFETYFKEQENGERLIWIAYNGKQPAGYITLKWQSNYEPFKEANIPEIMDLNVLPEFRNRGIGSALLEIAEKEASLKNNQVGLGVGLYNDYGQAQRLYIKRGYLPDGRGITYNYTSVPPGNKVMLDDDLILWFAKKL